MQPSILTDLKMGRQHGLSAKNADKLAAYFNVSVGYLLGTDTKKSSILSDGRSISDDDIKFALFGGAQDITDDMFEEVKDFAKYVQQREKNKNK